MRLFDCKVTAAKAFARAGGFVLLFILGIRFVGPVFASSQSASGNPYDRAERAYRTLEARPEAQRTKTDYEHVLDLFRAVYHDDSGDYSTNEPTMDGTASAILMFAMCE